ncbi:MULTISPECIES: TetR/AcrR family transcriptional regulator [Mumia]|uniref:TetR/AcrR family transcriptional regulator n=1 Tax=Mumia TaxID=1546255 RepID=UPI00142206F5|nr:MULTISPECIES: TetR family transcriptional regulator C-terminal domain-containing protein [unclassified Mumia]QMW65383.1 TetR family transcriptional regulator C-terminal domain-containing protein [Mumia sp. ZJ1417]
MASVRIGRPPLNDEAVEQRRSHILGVTLALVARDGADRVRLRDVAQEASVSVGMLQHYFATRDALLHEAFSAHAQEVVARVEVASRADVDPWERIRSLVLSITNPEDYLQRCSLWVEFAAAASRDVGLRTLMTEAYGRWRVPLNDAVQAGVDAGIFHPVLPPASVVENLLALIDGYEVALAIEEKTDVDKVADEMTAVAGALLGYDAGAAADAG